MIDNMGTMVQSSFIQRFGVTEAQVKSMSAEMDSCGVDFLDLDETEVTGLIERYKEPTDSMSAQ